GGTGLGLAIVKHLIAAHEWNMRIESEPARGTRVNIIIDRYL
ncbi:MAG: ATP-binding protein, partial [Nitrospiraceae bacterium]|nr:ATP-binding protein [Nitrospiraceae bacterium]